VRISPLPHTCHMPCQSQFLDLINLIIFGAQYQSLNLYRTSTTFHSNTIDLLFQKLSSQVKSFARNGPVTTSR
jgi:hypothetical protein